MSNFQNDQFGNNNNPVYNNNNNNSVNNSNNNPAYNNNNQNLNSNSNNNPAYDNSNQNLNSGGNNNPTFNNNNHSQNWQNNNNNFANNNQNLNNNNNPVYNNNKNWQNNNNWNSANYNIWNNSNTNNESNDISIRLLKSTKASARCYRYFMLFALFSFVLTVIFLTLNRSADKDQKNFMETLTVSWGYIGLTLSFATFICGIVVTVYSFSLHKQSKDFYPIFKNCVIGLIVPFVTFRMCSIIIGKTNLLLNHFSKNTKGYLNNNQPNNQ